MGVFYENIMLLGADGSTQSIRGMVDTGAMFTVVPASVLRRLGVQPIRRIPVQFATGEVQQWQLGQVEAELLGQKSPILVFFGAEDAPALIGAHTLEAFLLDVDVVQKKLVPKTALLMVINA